MNWIVATLLMFVCSVALYLAIRKAALNKLPIQFTNLATFGIPAIVFTIAMWATEGVVVHAWETIVLLILTGATLAYVPNIFSLKSIELAPNPGYSLVISKSYVVLTTFLAVPLFGAHLSVRTLLAVVCIVAFAALIVTSRRPGHAAHRVAWIPLALGAFLGWGLLSVAAKYLFTFGVTTLTFLAYVCSVVCLCVMIEMKLKGIALKPLRHRWQSFVLIGLLAAGFNYFNFDAIRIAPNVGYVNAVNAASIAAVTIFAILLFKDEFSMRKLVGVFGVIAGLVLLFI